MNHITRSMVVSGSYPWQLADPTQKWPWISTKGVEEEVVDSMPKQIRYQGDTSQAKSKSRRAPSKLRSIREIHGSPIGPDVVLKRRMPLIQHEIHRHGG